MNSHFFLPVESNTHVREQQNKLLTPQKVRELAFCSDSEARACLSVEDALSYQVLPLKLETKSNNNKLLFISRQDLQQEELKELEFITSAKLKQLSTTDGLDISTAIYQAYKADDRSLQEAKVELLGKADFKQNLIGDSLSFLREVKNIESKFIHRLIEYSIAREASDLHLVPDAKGLMLKIRILGEIYQHTEVVADLKQARMIANHLKVLASLKPSEVRLPQDGSFYFETAKIARWIRISCMPTALGEKIVLRLPKENYVPQLTELGLNQFTEDGIRKSLNSLSGLILIVGATGSGKTTTIYSMMQELKLQNLSLVSVEDPVEINLSGVEQTSVNPGIGFGYSTALKALLRQDPDVIMIGEIRDSSNAEIALQAAQSGHLVIAAIHAGSALGAIRRITELGINQSALLAVLNLVIFQQLVAYRLTDSLETKRKLLTETLILNNKIREEISSNLISVNNIHLRRNNYCSHRKELKSLLQAGAISSLQYERYYPLV